MEHDVAEVQRQVADARLDSAARLDSKRQLVSGEPAPGYANGSYLAEGFAKRKPGLQRNVQPAGRNGRAQIPPCGMADAIADHKRKQRQPKKRISGIAQLIHWISVSLP